MTLASTTPQVTYAGDGGTVDFDFAFKMWTDTVSDEIAVVIDEGESTEETLAYSTDYTLSAPNNDYSSGGTVTTIATYTSSQTITIKSNLTRSQEFRFTTNDKLNVDNLEDAEDRLVRLIQEAELQGTIEQTAITEFYKTQLTKPTAKAAFDSLRIAETIVCAGDAVVCVNNEIVTV
jgi:hypothetical protein